MPLKLRQLTLCRCRWLALLFCLAGCDDQRPGPSTSKPGPGDGWFAEVTDQLRLSFHHQTAGADRHFMPASIGSGGAFFDFNRDGLLDIYLVQNGGPDSGIRNQLFQQSGDGSFNDVSSASGLDIAGFGMGVAVGDINNDGLPDVLVTEYERLRLFRNSGDGAFREVTDESGLFNPHWGASASFFDYDRDGWLDLVVANYIEYSGTRDCFNNDNNPEFCAPSGFPPAVSKLFRNRGADGGETDTLFEDVSLSSGIAQVSGPSLGVVCADFDGDRWPDILFADDGAPNRLWINQQDGTFKEEGTRRGIAFNVMGQTQANMGIALGDANHDSMFDIFITHLDSEHHTLWEQGPRGLFADRSSTRFSFENSMRGTAFGTVMTDFNNDGFPDIALVNGGISRAKEFDKKAVSHLPPFWQPYAQRAQLFSSDDSGRFMDISQSNPVFSGKASMGRGLASGDFNNDGAVDCLVTNIDERARLMKNIASDRGHWLMVNAVLPEQGGREAYGAEITVFADGKSWWRLLQPGFGYLVSNDPRAHFGLGATTEIDAIRVIWPDGTEEKFPGGRADRPITLEKGTGEPPEAKVPL